MQGGGFGVDNATEGSHQAIFCKEMLYLGEFIRNHVKKTKNIEQSIVL